MKGFDLSNRRRLARRDIEAAAKRIRDQLAAFEARCGDPIGIAAEYLADVLFHDDLRLASRRETRIGRDPIGAAVEEKVCQFLAFVASAGAAGMVDLIGRRTGGAPLRRHRLAGAGCERSAHRFA